MKIRFFELAKKLATKSDYDRCKLGCVIVKKGKILGIGFNKKKTSPKATNFNRTIHAELDAILNAGILTDLAGSDLYIFRQVKDGTLARSFPCIHCQDLIREAGIKTIFYTDKNKYETRRL